MGTNSLSADREPFVSVEMSSRLAALTARSRAAWPGEREPASRTVAGSRPAAMGVAPAMRHGGPWHQAPLSPTGGRHRALRFLDPWAGVEHVQNGSLKRITMRRWPCSKPFKIGHSPGLRPWSQELWALTITFRSHGKISVELLGDVEGAGSTPDELTARLVTGYSLALDETIAADDPRAPSRTSTPP